MSWWVQHHVDEGRSKFNIHTPGFGPEASEAAETVREGEMPLGSYLITHPEARLTPAQTQALVTGLQKTFGGEGPAEDGGESRENEAD